MKALAPGPQPKPKPLTLTLPLKVALALAKGRVLGKLSRRQLLQIVLPVCKAALTCCHA